MSIQDLEKEALALSLRSKTALGRLGHAEVIAVLDFLTDMGFVHQPAATVEPMPIAPPPAIEPMPIVPPPAS